MYHEIQIKFDYGEIDIYRSWIMALILLEDRDFNGFWMKIWNAGVSVITRSTFSSVVLWLSHATNLRLQWNIYTIYVHCWKMYNLSLRSLETGCKANLFQTFLACLAMSTKEFADILCLSCNVKSPKQLPLCLKIAETNVVIIVFNDVLCEVCPYTVTVSFCHSTWIRYQKFFIRSMTK